jgi:6-phosphofructokinase 1
MRAGPRGGEYFNPSEVQADIVCLGNVCPGINTVIRELYIILKEVYQVKRVTGIKNSFIGYYENNFIELNSKIL